MVETEVVEVVEVEEVIEAEEIFAPQAPTPPTLTLRTQRLTHNPTQPQPTHKIPLEYTHLHLTNNLTHPTHLTCTPNLTQHNLTHLFPHNLFPLPNTTPHITEPTPSGLITTPLL